MMRHALVGLLLASAAIATAAPAPAATVMDGNIRVEFTGASRGPYTNLDQAVESWMTANSIHDAQLAVRQAGTLIFSHAYTMGSTYPEILTTSVFRLASISKMTATAALTTLLTKGRLDGGERVFRYLGIQTPLLPSQTPDPRINNIITLELAEHTSGLHDNSAGDPLFAMRDIEVQLGQEPLTKQQFAQYLYGEPLQSVPGTIEAYSNVGYLILGMVVEKASGLSFFDYVNKALLLPMNLKNWSLSPTSQAKANPNEVFADAPCGNVPCTGPSVFDITSAAPQDPFNFEGGDIIWENADAPSDFVTNAESVSAFITKWNVYGLGGRQYDYARDGCVPGVATWAESQTADVDWSLLLNKQPCLGFDSAVINTIRGILAGL